MTEHRHRSVMRCSAACSPLAAVADGVGGAAAGQVASRWAINLMMGLEKSRLTEDLGVALHRTVRDANATLRFLIDFRPEWSGMATTLTTVALSNDLDYLVANVGDSRTYLYRDERLRQLTRDQSFVQALVDRGALTAAEARVHPQRSLVLEALDGTDRSIAVPAHHRARAGDRLLLCSDGISDYLDDNEIAQTLRIAARDAAAEGLIAGALEAGGRDNVSAVVAEVVASADPEARWLKAL